MPASTLRRDCDLVANGDVYAQLRWQGAFRALAYGSCAEATWQFKLEGFLFRQWVTIHRLGEEKPVAIFHAQPSFNGTLQLADGRTFSWESNFWLTKWIWCDEEAMELARVQRHLTLRTEGSLNVPDEALANKDVPLLILLGWYLIQLVSDLRVG